MTDRYTLMDIENWDRKEVFKYYTEELPTICFSVTKKIDVRKTVEYLKANGKKTVPALIWLVSRELNTIENFRLATVDEKTVKWDIIHPVYPVINSTGNFTFHSVSYVENFSEFYSEYLSEANNNKDCKGVKAGSIPVNNYMLSVFPYMSFDSFSLQIRNAKGYYAPFIEIGKYEEHNGCYLMPVSISVNHATADLNHINIFFNRLINALNLPEGWCK